MTVGRSGFARTTLLAAYVLAAALLSFSHHDVICHLKSSTHCTSCLAGSSGETASGAAADVTAALDDAGQATETVKAFVHSTTIRTSSGRSPPACA
jgi:hypothetical protein